jgi:two-component system CheB/CheR fusion protein
VVAHEDITAIKAGEARMIALSQRLASADEDARRRLSAELHDRTSPNLTALRINLDLLAAALRGKRLTNVDSAIEDAHALIDDTGTSLREIGTNLRPPLLDYAGVHAAVEGYVDQFARRTGIEVRLRCSSPGLRLAPERESMLFRVVQEALTNCAKHAQARSIDVDLVLGPGAVTLTVADDGVGFVPDAVGRSGAACGMGLLNMRGMIEFAGGRLTIESSAGNGARIHAEL